MYSIFDLNFLSKQTVLQIYYLYDVYDTCKITNGQWYDLVFYSTMTREWYELFGGYHFYILRAV